MELSENLLREAAGWEVMKRARFCLEQGRVLSSSWAPPLLRGVVQEGDSSFRASMLIKSQVDIENLCTCREARQWGKICPHGVAAGLHWLQAQKPASATPPKPAPPARPSSPLPAPDKNAGETLTPRRGVPTVALPALGTTTGVTPEPQTPRFLLALEGGLARLDALLQCAYGPRLFTAGVPAPADSVWRPLPDAPARLFTRDFAAERAALARLQAGGFAGPDAQGKLRLTGQDAVLNFFARDFPKLQRDWSVTLEERLEHSAARNIERVQPRFHISSGLQWFDLGVVFAADGGETFAAADIQRLLLSGQSHTRLKNGKWAVLDTGAVEELQEVLLDCAPRQHAQGYRISNTQAGFLDATLRAHAEWNVQAPPAWRDRAARQSGEAKLACPPLGDLETVLRPYQKNGVAWLHFLRENDFGGILADEMGLGKTLQTLAFLNTLRTPACDPQSAIRNPHLIICPTSLVFNWVAEAAKFTPELKLLALHGPDRTRTL